ncbi:FYVE, RhoGEF and PH domain-containing protein 5 [Bombina bombina]|uniref:FYVE, RhoGEF and PH domain-containing protein 5 n=1 Tax=Bombina bombina TaxID=8345 RepID=UPI00235ABA34|nr:FYVE, RhoGEF and PH domain-containing protein 5 [Bombina bombina]
MSTDINKPALSPKPQVLDNFSPVTHPKRFLSPLISRASHIHHSNSMSRGPKPPIAPKPVLSPVAKRKSIEDSNNSLNKSTNGEVVYPMENIYDADTYSPEVYEKEILDMTYTDKLSVPDSNLTDEERADLECEASIETWASPLEEDQTSHGKSSPGLEEEDSGHIESTPSRDLESAESTEVEDSDNTDALSLRSSSTAEADTLMPPPECDTLHFKNDLGYMEEDLFLDSNECNIKNKKEKIDLKIVGHGDVILTNVCFGNRPHSGDTNVEDESCESCLETFNDSSMQSCNEFNFKQRETESVDDPVLSDGSMYGKLSETEAVTSEYLESTTEISGESTNNYDILQKEILCVRNNSLDDAIREEISLIKGLEEYIGNEKNNVIGEEPRDINPVIKQEAKEVRDYENMDESCQIIPFESEGNDDITEALVELMGRENCLHKNLSDIFSVPECEQRDNDKYFTEERRGSDVTHKSLEVTAVYETFIHEEDVSGSSEHDVIDVEAAGMSSTHQETKVKEPAVDNVQNIPIVEDCFVPKEEEDNNPYVLEDSVQSRSEKMPHAKDLSHIETEEEELHSCCLKEQCGIDGENHSLCYDRKNIVTRTRSYSGKIHGNVPETVPEETGAEAESLLLTNDSKKDIMSEHLEAKPLDLGRVLPRKPSRFILYPRSYSVEGRNNTASLYIESDVSSPYIIASSGSFSQRDHHSSSGMSTPTSVVDIPPPFELASITKKPITKSSPSLLIENESSEKNTKKKKSSFKKFLTLKFKKKTENKVHVDVNVSSSRSSSESSYHRTSRLLDFDQGSLGSSPQLHNRSSLQCFPDSPAAMLFYKDMKRKGTSRAFSRSVARVESFEDRSRPPFISLPLTKPRSISFPNADTSDYENIPAMSSDYENIQIPPTRPSRAGTFTEFFEDPSKALSSANENDGYVDMSSFNSFEIKQQTPEQETESAYTEPYKVCPIPLSTTEDITSDEEQKTSEDEGHLSAEPGVVQKKEGPVRALSIVKDLVNSEREYVETLRQLHTEFHAAVLRVLGNEEEDEEEDLKLRHGLSELQDIYLLHEEILEELQQRILHWEERQKIADLFLRRESSFHHHTAFIVVFDKTIAALDSCSRKSPQLAAAVKEYEKNPQRGQVSVKHELLMVVQRVFQYHMILTDYLNNLCPDWPEYEDTQAALLMVLEVADRANDSLRHGENLQKLVQIEYSVQGQRSLVQPGREFVKEGTLMKVSGKTRHPRHLSCFLMNDILLYTYPQKDGKYRLKSALSIPGMRVSRPIVEDAQNVMKIECMERCLMLSASSCSERDEWYSCISRTVQEYYKAPTASVYHNNVEIRERLDMYLGERPPSVAFLPHVTMCMNCGSDFSLTLRRHHCHACGKIVCRSCSRNKYPLKYLKDRPSKVCNICYSELKKREVTALSMNPSPPMPRSAASAFSSMLHHIHPSSFRKHKKIPSALIEAATSGENSSISGYLHRCKKGKKYWKKRWFVIKGKVLYTYATCEDKVATESLPLLGFNIVPDTWDQSPKLGTVFQLYHKQTLFYSFKARDTNSAIRWVDAMKLASVL